MMKKFVLVLLLLFILFISCGLSNCNDEMADVRAKMGAPEEIDRYDSEGYHSVDWWYWSKGICYGFIWGTNVDGCETSTYQFDPIKKFRKQSKDSLKIEIKNQKPNSQTTCWESSY